MKYLQHVYLHDLTSPENVKKLAVQGAVLDVAWSPNSESRVFVAGLGHQVRSLDFSSGQDSLITQHDAPVKCVEHCAELDSVVSASWDSTLRITPLTTPTQTLTLPLPAKAYCLALSANKIIVGMAARAVWIYDLETIKQALNSNTPGDQVQVWQKRESSLKFMTRAIAAMPNNSGYTTTSIEGRVAVEFFDSSETVQKQKYAFKCHRQVIEGVDTVYPVQGLAYNPLHGTFATGGGDSTVSIWDQQAKKRLRQLPKFPSPISSLAFSHDGQKLAVAYSELDEGGAGLSGTGGNGITVRECADECKPKVKA